ncbi:pyruvate formate lyase-activating protein [bacterium]|nr:pyruvate formate lyase-activating protein [bacterium]
MKNIIGRIHSIETLGTHDGPGLRCVFFLAGCNFRCTFCHNPDTWTHKGSQKMTLSDARLRLEPLLPYLRQHGGGVTVSGGEPTMQSEFVQALFKMAHAFRLNTVLDTNGSCHLEKAVKLLKQTDLVLLDIKACDPKTHQLVTGKPLAPVLAFGRLAAKTPGRLTIRRVLLPGINDSPEEMNQLAEYAVGLKYQPPIELIAYHRLGVHKWEELGIRYSLKNLKPPSQAAWKQAAKKLEMKGLTVFKG